MVQSEGGGAGKLIAVAIIAFMVGRCSVADEHPRDGEASDLSVVRTFGQDGGVDWRSVGLVWGLTEALRVLRRRFHLSHAAISRLSMAA